MDKKELGDNASQQQQLIQDVLVFHKVFLMAFNSPVVIVSIPPTAVVWVRVQVVNPIPMSVNHCAAEDDGFVESLNLSLSVDHYN